MAVITPNKSDTVRLAFGGGTRHSKFSKRKFYGFDPQAGVFCRKDLTLTYVVALVSYRITCTLNIAHCTFIVGEDLYCTFCR